MERLGDAVDGGSFVRYEPLGGRCTRPGCNARSPIVELVAFKRKMPLPCADHQAEEDARVEQDERDSRAARFLTESGMTPRLSAFSLDTYREVFPTGPGRDALAVGERWLKTFYDTGAAPNLLLYGEPGNGKTGLAWSMVRDLCENGYRAKIVNFKRLLEEMKACYSQRLPASQAFDVGRVPILALDDLGSEKPTEWARGELLGIVDGRYEAGLPTIYVSNYHPDALANRLGRDDPTIGLRIISRMVEGSTQHRHRGDDHRVPKQD